jgi:hypothetical protein
MNPNGPGAKTLTLPIAAAVVLLLWLWVGRDAACSLRDEPDPTAANGFQRLPYEAATAPEWDMIPFGDDITLAGGDYSEDGLTIWRPREITSRGFGADLNYQPPPYIPPPLENIIPPPGYVVHTGIVMDKVSRKPISGAHFHVETSQGRYGGSANFNGEFAVVSSVGDFAIEISAQGYESVSYDTKAYYHQWISLEPVQVELQR